MQTNMSPQSPSPRGLRTVLTLAGAAVSAGLYAQSVTPTEPQKESAEKAAPTEMVRVASAADDVVMLSPFEVSEASSKGYVATSTLAGSRINTKLEDVGSAISVVTAEFLRDVGATDNKTLLTYTVGTEVGGLQGNYRGASGGSSEDESGKFSNPNGNTRVRGLTSADNTRNFFGSSIPWDGYNIDRVDMQRGPNSILFGLGSPAGIINTTTKTAQHRDFGEVEIRFGSYDANRQSIDINKNILKKELSLRVNLVRNDEKYKQEPAYSLDRRVFGTLRYDPRLLNKGGTKTGIKLNYESGTIRSNNPRTITPTDQLTAWWTKLGHQTFNPNNVQNSGIFYDANGNPYWPSDAGQFPKTRSDANGVSSTNPNYMPWLGDPETYGGVWMQYDPGQSTAYAVGQSEYRNKYGISSAGAVDGGIGGLPYSRRVTVATPYYVAQSRDSTLPYASWGVWKNYTLSDSSIFDFYNNLLDGDNKKEWSNFHNFSASVNQTFFDGLLGYDVSYNQERYRRGQNTFMGEAKISVDINAYNIDGTPNKNVGRPYISSGYGSNSSETTLEASRLSLFLDHNFNKDGKGPWWAKLIGRHTISGLYSRDMYKSDWRSYKRYGTEDSFGYAFNSTTEASSLESNSRNVSSLVYLGDSLLSASSPQNAHIQRAGYVSVPDSVQYRYFDSRWNNPNVDPGSAWTSTLNGSKSTQAENPANYVGWTSMPVKILNSDNDSDREYLTTGATLNKRKVESKAAVWQAYFWDGAVVGMYGIRNDKVKSWAYSGTKGTTTGRVDLGAKDSNGFLQYSTEGKPYNLHEANSPSWSVVVKLNPLLGNRLPFNISYYYNKSQNFQITGTRNNIYGESIAAPSGNTIDRGIMLSTKDGRFSARINKYVTSVKNASNTSKLTTWFLLGNFIQRNENLADAYQYHLSVQGDPTSADKTDGTSSQGFAWKWTPGVGQTQAQADAQRDAAIAAWRAYTQEPMVQRILKAWGFNDFNVTQLTALSTPVANFTATEDQVSKGWEYELTANPTRNWRVSFNAAKTEAMRTNVGGTTFAEFVDLTNTYQHGPMGFMRQWGGDGATSTSLTSWNSNFYGDYSLMKLLEGTYSGELRRWRYNLVMSYSFSRGMLKGVTVGGGYRWQDRVVIGYPPLDDGSGKVSYDINHPYYGPSQDGIDLWIGYSRKLSSKVDWRVQLNVRNVGDGNKVYPLSTQWDGSVAAWGIAPSQSWTLTNTFKF